ncbi:spindle pole body associated protein SnaD [Aspergillus nomiae NRRL 13137]|uniref:Spindle pole body associated protein SnaD n=1 Tax=Aspergillus nomiae NRRL (strain ATCC 15546 / NRRL 13137 / CBS 260.88 / M93) TaxID=1509407 RepID=A0A0L1JBB7_ASPN3|nr:spindle pole body associated protein SnaD [Aspergillus nomiae NRRL 13137]KNG88728.1 spindle pole body associated protein SnaD [Aspergillus nomiae NRRL 13137]
MDTTSHDTVGASTLATPLFMPSSPPSGNHSPEGSPQRARSPISRRAGDDIGDARSPTGSPPSSRASSLDRAAKELDARLADYTLDFDQFPSGQLGLDERNDEPFGESKLPHEDQLSDVGGPEDFTANLEKYLMGDDDDTFDHKDLGEVEEEEEPALEEQEPPRPQSPEQKQQEQQQSSQLQQPAVEDEAELGEYSEFAPVDMSTPSHLLRRVNAFSKEVTQLENIEEDPDDEPDTVRTPSVRRHKPTSSTDQTDMKDDLLRQIAELKQAVQERDEQLERNHRRVLEAASAGEQIKHLQAELQKKTALLDEAYANRNDDSLLREQIQLLQKQNEEKESLVMRASVNEIGISALQEQIAELRKEFRDRLAPTDIDSERLETIANLRQQLNLAQEQLKKRDATLDETLARLNEVTTAKELQLREKNTETDGLKAQIDDHLLEIQKLEAEVDRANREYRTLEDRIATLEIRNRPLEEKNSTLEADLSRAQSQVTAQENALKAMAADLPWETGRNTYEDILELINSMPIRSEAVPKGSDSGELELEQLREELTKLQTEQEQAISTRKALETQLKRSQEQAAEAQSLINSIEGENTRLSKRAEELKSNLDKAGRELNELRDEYSEAQDTIQRLQEEKNTQQPSPPPSPPTTRQKETALEETHQAQLRSLQTAHATAISNLRASHADSIRKLRNLLGTAEKRETKLKSELQSLRTSRSTQENEIDSLRAEIKELETIIKVKDETAAALDRKIARSVESREKVWADRVDSALRQRDQFGKAFLYTVGQKELGENKVNFDDKGRPTQPYQYAYVKKNGRKKA